MKTSCSPTLFFALSLLLCSILLTTHAKLSDDEQPQQSNSAELKQELLATHARVRRSSGDDNRRSRIVEAMRTRYRSPFPRPDSMMADNPFSRTTTCGQVEMDPSGALCCEGIVYSRRPGVELRCCGSVAYDNEFFDCCGPAHRQTIVRRAPVMPACCDHRSDVECPRTTDDSLGSVCCQLPPGDSQSAGSDGASWRCCLREDRCCDGLTTVTQVDVPGYRPACCEVDRDAAARCCAETYERIGLLPHCCDDESLRPICCRRPDGSTRCCPANYGYCCGQGENPIPSTVRRRRPATPYTGPQSDSSLRQLQPRTGDRAINRDSQPQRQDRDRDPYYVRNRYETRDRDRYPTETVPPLVAERPDSAGRTDDQAANSTDAPNCCVRPSPRCCPSNSNGRQVPPCCRPVACRQGSFSASRCPPRGNSGCPRCPGQGSGCSACPGQGGGGGGGGCPQCPRQGSGCPVCPGQGGGGGCPRCPGQGSRCGACPGQGGGCPVCPGQGGGGGGCPRC